MSIQYAMTAGKLQDQLAKFPADTKVLVYWEAGKPHQCFEIDEISLHSGSPCRDDKNGAAGFKFESGGPARWLFISVSPE